MVHKAKSIVGLLEQCNTSPVLLANLRPVILGLLSVMGIVTEAVEALINIHIINRWKEDIQ